MTGPGDDPGSIVLDFMDGPLAGREQRIPRSDLPTIERAGITAHVTGIAGWHLYSAAVKPSVVSPGRPRLAVYFRKTVRP